MNKQKLLNFFKNELEKQQLSENTVSCYLSDLEHFINNNPNLENADILKYKSTLLENHIANKTISRKFQSIRKFFKLYNGSDPTKGIIIPKGIKREINFLTKEEIQKLLDSVRDDKKIFTAINLLLQTGILLSELVNLKIKDIDLTNYKITVRDRLIPINNKLLYNLEFYISTFHNDSDINYPLFVTSNSTSVLPRNMRTYITRAMKKAGIDKTVNDLRNTFIVHQLNSGNSIEFVGKIVGHRSKQTTERYLKLVDNYQNKDSNKIFEV